MGQVSVRAQPERACGPSIDIALLHDETRTRLAALDQRYTASRRALVEALVAADRPVTIPEVLIQTIEIPQSSAYRNLTVLCEAGVVRRLPGADDVGRFELAEDLSGHHHHHLVCSSCGRVADIKASPRLEKALAEAARLAAAETGFEVSDHRIDLGGLCPQCR